MLRVESQFPDQESNFHPCFRSMESQLLDHQGGPCLSILNIAVCISIPNSLHDPFLAYICLEYNTNIPAKSGIKVAGRNINNLRYSDNTTLMAESEEELNSLLMKVNFHEVNSWWGELKTQHLKTKIMASSTITSWQIDGETMETVTDFILGGSKITADGDCSHEIKRCLLLGQKAMTNLDSVLRSRDITPLTKVCKVTTMVFPVVM